MIDKLAKSESESLHTYVLDARLQTHDLTALAGATLGSHYNFAFSREERDLLRRLSKIIKWHGRYPLAITSEKQSSLYFRPVGDRVMFQGLWDRLSAALEGATEKSA